MSQPVKDVIARGDARIVSAPVEAPRHQVEFDRNFELPTGLFAATAGCYLAFMAITGAAFANPVLAIPMTIIALIVVAAFGVPAIWTRLKKNGLESNDTDPLTIGQFETNGIVTNTGRLAPRDATIQVLILPVLIVLWGLAAVTIAALI